MSKFITKEHPLTKEMNALDRQVEEGSVYDAIPKLSNNFFWIICAPAGGGKTTMLLNLMRISHKKGGLGKYYKKIFIISPTHQLDDKLQELTEELGDEQCFDELNDATVDTIKQSIKSDEDFKKEHYLIIMDDCLGMMPSSSSKSKAHNLLISRRHLHCSIILLVQSYIRIPNLWRRNANLISFFGTPNKKEVECLLDDINDDPEKMTQLIKDATEENHSFLTIRFMNGSPIYYKKFDKYQ
jgi:hypothetical protein